MTTLNLLPIQDKKNLVRNQIILISKDITYSLLLLGAILSIILLICHLILIKNFIQISQNSLSIVKSDEIITQKIRRVNKNLKIIESIQEKNINWVKILLTLSKLTPQDEVQITNLEINSNKNLITLQGKSLTRDAFLTFKQRLENSGLFCNIKSPLSNLLSAKNLNFKLEMSLKQNGNK